MNTEQAQQLYRALGVRIRQQRDRLKLSQGALADQVSISRVSIVNIEKGQQHTPLHILFEIARVLELELTALLPSLSDVFGKGDEIGPSRMAHIEEKTAGKPESRDRLIEFVRSVTSDKGEKKDDTSGN